ncbi:hypothetical protein FMM05_07810 [Flavobacterium zepuense]|uniref:DUF4157 domain-containing protein n=1 Tax=Flavobacterium zepuense TaxID=2593302 RepID=A0A552V417_9FLAO|nr:hypothetical protein [Flavobacterium zepuense]TRW25203.1 hypothetical protein FMM05_07810 [Flavobacterium zepuense]
MIVITSKYLIPQGYTAMALYPFIIVRDARLANSATLLNHECIHLRQQAEMLILPFYIWYISEYFIRLIRYHDRKRAYRNICFEREAYANESNLNYLGQRPFWGFLKYIKT